MMQNFLLIAIVVLLIAAIIRVLHRYQLREMRDSADRSAPLTPSRLDFQEPGEGEPEPNPDPEEMEADGAPPWQREIKLRREQGDFAGALELSRARHPRIQAYQQTLVTLRGQIRQAQKGGRSLQPMLSSLYRHAALADLFRHDSPCRLDPDDPQASRLAALAAERLDLPWSLIGYRKLRLLTRTDIRLLTEAWGEPGSHQHTEEVEGGAWRELERELKAT